MKTILLHVQDDDSLDGLLQTALSLTCATGGHLSCLSADEASVADALLARASKIGATCLVMGGYGHSRIGEYIFGGVTRSLLKDSPVSLFVAR